MNKGQRQPAKRRRSSAKKQSSTSRSQITRADVAALEQLDRLLALQRRQEQLARMVPPGIETSQHVFDNGSIIYRFSHEELGELGQLKIVPVPFMVSPGLVHVSAEIASADPDEDEHWDEKYTLFKEMVTLCISALPASPTVLSPPLCLDEARIQCRLYLRFLDYEHSLAMFALAKQLPEAESQQLRDAIETA